MVPERPIPDRFVNPMTDTKHILSALQQNYGPLPGALLEHLGTCLTPRCYGKGQLLLRPGQTPAYAWFLSRGAARGYLLEEQKGEEVTLWFWLPGEVVVALDSFCRQVPASFYLELLEDSVLYRMSFRELEQAASAFPAFRRLERAVVESYLLRITRHFLDRSRLPARERFRRLMEQRPQLFHRAPVKHIASFLGMYPDTLSRLRSEK